MSSSKRLVDGPQRRDRFVAVDQHRDFDLAGGDHQDVDARVGQGAEHLPGDAGLPGHAQPDDRNLGHVVVVADAFGLELGGSRLGRLERGPQIVLEHGERNVGDPVGADVLHDHVHRDRLGRDLGKNRQARARPVGHAQDRDAGFVLDQRRAADRLVGRLGQGGDHRARHVAETAADVDRHGEFLGELDRAVVHHAGPQAGQLEHLVVADLLDVPGLGQDAGIGRVDAVDVGVDFAGVGLQHGRQGHGRGVAAAAAQRGDVEVLVDALKAGGDDDLAFVQRPAASARSRSTGCGPWCACCRS